ncbi:uncharacterized protein LTR77_004575 [Saxophila tyrrhenica]|uniref:gamma-glutamylcyclotransferase n=1 Tax=Saxophila tyrrhenica TaxID=1690608 RepID=A0AAV9PD64_9PEZI|nr:hypothetical protein LTR77_004575 [Saxophila tyrrhenica]
MPVLEAVAAVANIVATFQSAAGLYNGWKARKEVAERANRPVPEDFKTQTSLVRGRQQVQEEYDRAYARLGARFAQGDDEGRMQLQGELIMLQQTVIAFLQSGLASPQGRLNISQLLAHSEGRRAGTVTALTNQYQRMTTAAPIRSLKSAETPRANYFAFASNLHLEQMAARCSSSMFRGKATLRGWRWQVNERGFANIVPSPSDHVEGLVFTVRYEDQLTLHRYEGISKGYYECRTLPVKLTECVEGLSKTSFIARQLSAGHAPPGATRAVDVDALVYVSSTYVTDGRIRAEYAERMKLGIADGVALGMSPEYTRRYLEPHVTPSKPGGRLGGLFGRRRRRGRLASS